MGHHLIGSNDPVKISFRLFLTWYLTKFDIVGLLIQPCHVLAYAWLHHTWVQCLTQVDGFKHKEHHTQAQINGIRAVDSRENQCL